MASNMRPVADAVVSFARVSGVNVPAVAAGIVGPSLHGRPGREPFQRRPGHLFAQGSI